MSAERADLHVHSDHSDGRYPPHEVVEFAAAAGLRAVSLTDHDTVAGWPEFTAACSRRGLVAIEGVELSAHLGARDAHILGYHVRTGSAELLAALAVFRADREDRARRIVERLNDLGVPLSLDDVRRLAGRGVLARPHIAEALFEAGFVPNYNDAFRRYLGIGSPAYVPKKRFEPEQAIALIHAAGGVAVLAHPATEFVESDIVGLAGLGLDGVEVVHPRHTPEMTRDLERLAARIGLVTTGGSDFHGGGRGESRVGHPAISYDRVKELGRQS